MNVFQILAGIGSFIGLLSALGFAYVFLRGSVDKGTIASLKESVSALQIGSDLKDKKIDAQGITIKHLTAELSTLRNVVTNAKEVNAIYTLLTLHHKEAMEHLDRIEAKR